MIIYKANEGSTMIEIRHPVHGFDASIAISEIAAVIINLQSCYVILKSGKEIFCEASDYKNIRAIMDQWNRIAAFIST